MIDFSLITKAKTAQLRKRKNADKMCEIASIKRN